MNDFITKLLSEWSYQIPEGIPNPKNEKHLEVLSNILEKYQVPEDTIFNILETMRGNKEPEKPYEEPKQFLNEQKVSPALFEMGISVEYNKLQGMEEEKALRMAEVEESKYNQYKGIIDVIGRRVAKELGNVGPFLKYTGALNYSLSPEWPSRDRTPKTDILGNNENRISLKKEKRSQLISGGKDDAMGVFNAAIQFYENYNEKPTDLSRNILERIENEFVKFKMDDSVREVKEKVSDFYAQERFPEIKRELGRQRLSRELKDKINKHIKAEMVILGITKDIYRGKAKEHLMDGVSVKRDLKAFFNDFLRRGEGPQEIKEKMIGVISATISHKQIQSEIEEVLKDNEFKKWMVYEAASGTYKFTGQPDLSIIEDPVANKILVFNDNGILNFEPITPQWASKYGKDVNVIVGFKRSHRSSRSALRLMTEQEEFVGYDTGKTLLENDVELIIREQVEKMAREDATEFDELIEEGIFKDLKKWAKKISDAIRNKLKKLLDRIKTEIFTKLKQYIDRGIQFFLDALGLEMHGESYVNVTF